jgi:hypothetical protein
LQVRVALITGSARGMRRAHATLLSAFRNFDWWAQNGQKGGERFNSWILS